MSGVISLIQRRIPAFHVFWIILLLSVCWHWVHLYKAAWASKHSKLMQSTEIPAECRPQEMTWYQTIQASASSLVSSVDKCEEYHKVGRGGLFKENINQLLCRLC